MFEDPGEKLKKVAVFTFIFSTVAFIILACVFGWDRSHYRYSEFLPIPFFSLLIGGPLGSYIASLCLYAFGELVDKSCTYAYKNNALLDAIKKNSTEN